MTASRPLPVLIAVAMALLLGGCLTATELERDFKATRAEVAARKDNLAAAEKHLDPGEQALEDAKAAQADPVEEKALLGQAETELTAAREELNKGRSTVEPYKPNFALPLTYDYQTHGDRKTTEFKFQFSLKVRPFDFMPFYFGYTQKSFWQIYDGDRSRPFRENNFNPEGFFDWGWGDLDTRFGLQVGLEHESNGRGFEIQEDGTRENRSRSWNRLYVQPKLGLDGKLLATLKLWDRLNESPKEGENDPNGDDNPDIEEYLGKFELQVFVRLDDEANYELLSLIRKGSRRGSGTYQFDLLFNPSWFAGSPWFSAGVYMQLHYFNGYGESLIDYNEKVKKVGLGFTIGDPLVGLMPAR